MLVYVRTTRCEWVTPEWADGRHFVDCHMHYLPYPASSDIAQRWLQWVATMPPAIRRAYAGELARQLWQSQKVRDGKRLHRKQRFGISERLERV